MSTLKVALVQLDSGPDVAVNIASVKQLIAGLEEIDLAVFPECAVCRSEHQGIGENALPADEWIPWLAPIAEQLGAPVVFGGVPVCGGEALPRRIFNSSLVISPEGEVLARYDKMHLFQLAEDQHTRVDETEIYAPGNIPTLCEVGAWQMGLSICYDLRFPELFRQYVPASLMICTAAFTEQTGRDHWEILLRARAIENQCYMIGVGQCGEHPTENLRHYGHSMCVDPWGKVIAEAADQPACLIVELDDALVDRIRARIPALRGLQVNNP